VKNKKIYRDKKGRDYIKDIHFVGGKMKTHRIYVIDDIPADEFYEKNATDLDFFINGDYWLMSSEKDSNTPASEQNNKNLDMPDKEDEDLPF